jgi:hypothetical protein
VNDSAALSDSGGGGGSQKQTAGWLKHGECALNKAWLEKSLVALWVRL